MTIFGKEAFAGGLKELGYAPEDLENNRLVFTYTIPTGRFKDEVVKLGLEIPPDFNATCPTGPHVKPRLIANNPNGGPEDRAADSAFGADWQYFSRPFGERSEGWNRTTKDVKAYLRHVHRVFEALK